MRLTPGQATALRDAYTAALPKADQPRHPGTGRFTSPSEHSSAECTAGQPGPLRSPGDYNRPYLSDGHQDQRPVTAPRIPDSHPADAQSFDRPALTVDHQAVSPGDLGDANPNPPGSPAGAIYHTGLAAREAGTAADRADRLSPPADPAARSAPATSLPIMVRGMQSAWLNGMRDMTGVAPGETR